MAASTAVTKNIKGKTFQQCWNFDNCRTWFEVSPDGKPIQGSLVGHNRVSCGRYCALKATPSWQKQHQFKSEYRKKAVPKERFLTGKSDYSKDSPKH